MNDWILKLTGKTVDAGSEIMGSQLEFHGNVEWGWVALLAFAFAVILWISYRWLPVELSGRRKAVLVVLRATFLVLLLGILLGPVLSLELSRKVRRTLLVLIDNSQSMAIADPRVTPDDVKRAAIAREHLDPAKGLEQSLEEGRRGEFTKLARTDILQSVLTNRQLNLLPALSEEFDLVTYSFGSGGQVRELQRVYGAKEEDAKLTLEDFPWIDEIGAVHLATALGDSLIEILDRKRGQPLAGIWVISDGAHNTGILPRIAGAELSNVDVPLFLYGVGITSPADIVVTDIDAPSVAFLEDELLVRVRVRSQGLGNKQGLEEQLILRLNGEKVAEESVNFGQDGEQQVQLRFGADVAGDFELKAEITAREDETDSNNNAATRHLRIVDDKIRVLFVDQSPRDEFRFLRQVLTRDRRMKADILLLEADPEILSEEKSPYIKRFPENKNELFEYDVLIFGDVDPKRLSGTQMENINEFVSRFGGAFVMIAGRRFSPLAYLDNPTTDLIADLLPVEPDSDSSFGNDDDTVFSRPIKVQLTELGRDDPMLNLADADSDNDQLWDNLAPIYWVASVESKPGAEVLAVDPDQETGHGKLPIITRHQYGLGQVLYVGTDNIWRWRRNVGDRLYTRLWGQISQRMAQQQSMGADKRTQISLNKENFMTGDRVRVFARLYQAGYEPFAEEEVGGVYTSATDGIQGRMMLKVVPGKPGLYLGEFIAPAAGQYQFQVESSPETRQDFTVREASLEMAETAMNANLMKDLATLTNGRFFREENLHELPETIGADRAEVRSRMEVALGTSPLYFILIMFVVTIEWVVRKFSYLK
jgi:hypothetical protein